MDKKEYLTNNGFRPIVDTEDNTLYVKENMLVTVANKKQSLDDLIKEINSFFEGKDISSNNTESIEPNSNTLEGNTGGSGDAESDPDEDAGGADDEPDSAEKPETVEESLIEEVEPFFLCEKLRNVPTPIFRRLTIDGNRFYFRVMEDELIKLYASATNLINDGYVERSNSLTDWKQLQKMMGKDPEEVAQYEADKGTIMHVLYGLYMTGRDIYLRRSSIIALIEESDVKISKKNMDRFKSSRDDIDNMMERLKRFAKFCSDYKVKVLAIEKILSCEEFEVASPIDAIVEMTVQEKEEGYFGEVYKVNGKDFKKGDPKKSTRIVDRTFEAVLDFKSGGIYPSHAFQLNLYKMMVEEWYGDVINIEKIYNFSPKSESSKGYTLRDQTGCSELKKANAVYTQGFINHQNKNKRFKIHKGCLNINKQYDENEYTKECSITEELEKRFRNN